MVYGVTFPNALLTIAFISFAATIILAFMHIRTNYSVFCSGLFIDLTVETFPKVNMKNMPVGLVVHQTAVSLLVRMQPVNSICLNSDGKGAAVLSPSRLYSSPHP